MGSIKVYAVPPHRVARIGADGRACPPPNWVGWRERAVTIKGEPVVVHGLPTIEHVPTLEGSDVEDHSHYRRAAARRECTIGEPGDALLEELARIEKADAANQPDPPAAAPGAPVVESDDNYAHAAHDDEVK